MIPLVEFVDCTPSQVSARIEELMRGDTLARTVVVESVAGDSVIGVYEGIRNGEVLVEVDEASQLVTRIPLSQVTKFGEYVPPLDRSDEVGRE